MSYPRTRQGKGTPYKLRFRRKDRADRLLYVLGHSAIEIQGLAVSILKIPGDDIVSVEKCDPAELVNAHQQRALCGSIGCLDNPDDPSDYVDDVSVAAEPLETKIEDQLHDIAHKAAHMNDPKPAAAARKSVVTQIHSAQPCGDVTDIQHIHIDTTMPRLGTLEDQRMIYEEDADNLVAALVASLPGGTLDRVMVLLMKRKLSDLIVTGRTK